LNLSQSAGFGRISGMRAPSLNWRMIALIAAAVLLKGGISAITPSSSDFSNIAKLAFFSFDRFVFFGLYTFSVYFMNIFYRLWLLLPIDHPAAQTLFKPPLTPSFSLFSLTFMLKLPLLIFDVLTGLLVYKIVLRCTQLRSASLSALSIWLLNPYVTLLAEVDGTVDIISTCFVVASVYFFLKDKIVLSALCLAIGIVARFYPLALLPLYLLLLLRKGRVKGCITFTVTTTLVLMTAVYPFVTLRSWTELLQFAHQIPLGGNKEVLWFFGAAATGEPKPEVSTADIYWRTVMLSDQYISLVVLLCVILYFVAYKYRRASGRWIIDSVLSVLLVYFAMGTWQRYYTMWITPFITLDYSLSRKSRASQALFLLFFLSAFLYISMYSYFIGGFFGAFMPYHLAELETISNLIKSMNEKLVVGDVLPRFAKSMFSGVCIVYLVRTVARNCIWRRSNITSAAAFNK